jgi:hypothetical protein
MRRIFWLLAAAAAVLGMLLLATGPTPHASDPLARAADDAPIAYGGWALGLLTGLALAWLATIDWRDLPARAALWLRLQRRRLSWAVWGALFAGILLFF